ncbi:MAG: putative sulfate exporter family transporter [Bacillota bacterium]
MTATFKKIGKYLPGVALALVIGIIAKIIEELLPIHIIGASVIALLIGVAINTIWAPKVLNAGAKFMSKRVLKFAIILLGAGLSIQTILTVGSISLVVMCFTLATCFGGGYFIGKVLKLNWKMSNLISAGTGICGGSAIAAIAPAIDATDTDVAMAMSATFLFDMIMIIIFPLMGQWLGLSDMAYGLWAGTAVNDTSSVVAAGYAFSDAAGDFAVMVKLTRTLAIIPVVIIFSFINIRIKKKEMQLQSAITTETTASAPQTAETGELTLSSTAPKKYKINYFKLIPWFIVGFLAMAGLNSLGIIPEAWASGMKEVSSYLMVSALAAIGLNTSFRDMKKAGAAPMVHGFIISALVVIVAIVVELAMGLV